MHKTGQRNKGWIVIYILAIILIVLTPLDSANAQRDWAVTLYTGRLTDTTLDGIVKADFTVEDAYYVGLGLMRRIYTYRRYFDLQLEGQANRVFGDQNNWEYDLFGYIRWLPFQRFDNRSSLLVLITSIDCRGILKTTTFAIKALGAPLGHRADSPPRFDNSFCGSSAPLPLP